MLEYFAKRVLVLIPKLFIITLLIFTGIYMVPGDPLTHMIPLSELAEFDLEHLEAMREYLGINDPFFVQYFRWLTNVLRGNFGYSLVSGGCIRASLASRLPATMELAGLGLLISIIFGVVLGFVSAVRKNGIFDYFTTFFGMIGISVPEFFFGLLGILFFALTLNILPTGGRMSLGNEAFVDRWQYLVMPAVCLGIALIADLMRYTRSSMLDVLSKDYIKASQSRGTPDAVVYVKHALRNALTPVIIIMINRLRLLVGGTVVIENVFNYAGVGNLLLNAISGSDMPLIMMTTLIIAVAILLISLLMDVATVMLDPRVKIGNYAQEVH